MFWVYLQINLDFEKLYPECRLTIEKKWENFFNTLYKIRNSNLREKKALDLKRTYETILQSPKDQDEKLQNLRILLLPYLVAPTSRVKTNNGTVKPSITDSVEGFIVLSKVCIFSKYI